MIHLRSVYLLSLIVSFGFAARAEDSNEAVLASIPPLFNLQVFQSERDPEHYIVVGKDSHYMDAGNYHVIDSDHGKITSPQLTKDSMYWYSGGLDFTYETGQRLYVTPHVLEQGALLERIDTGLIDAHNGHEPLRKMELSAELLQKLNLTPIADPSFMERLKSSAAPTQNPQIAKPEPLVLITATFVRDDSEGTRKLEEKLEADPEVVHLRRLYPREGRVLEIWTFKSHQKDILANVKKHLKVDGKVIEDFAAQIPEDEVTTEAADEPVVSIYSSLYNLNNRYSDLMGLLDMLGRGWQNSESAVLNVERNYKVPLEARMSQDYERLHQIATQGAHEVLLFGEGATRPRLPYFTGEMSPGKPYFNEWLQLLRQRINRAKSASPQQVGVNSSGGGVLGELGFLNVDLSDYSVRGGSELNLEYDRRFYPLLVLGLQDSPERRAQVEQFIVAADKDAEELRRRFSDDHAMHSDVEGNKILVSFIQSLASTGEYFPYELKDTGFSQAVYYTQAMKIVGTLLSTSRTTIKNSATYLALLSVAIRLPRLVEHRFGLVPNRGQANSPELDALTEELIRLQRVTQTRALRAVYNNLTLKNGPCEYMLLPQ